MKNTRKLIIFVTKCNYILYEISLHKMTADILFYSKSVGVKGNMINLPLKTSHYVFVDTCRYLYIGSKNFCNISMYP